jgi:hypothetical protein
MAWEFGRNRPKIETMFKVQFALIGVRPLVIERCLFKSDEAFTKFLGSEIYMKFLRAFHSQEVVNQMANEKAKKTKNSLPNLPEPPAAITPEAETVKPVIEIKLRIVPLPIAMTTIIHLEDREYMEAAKLQYEAFYSPLIEKHIKELEKEIGDMGLAMQDSWKEENK